MDNRWGKESYSKTNCLLYRTRLAPAYQQSDSDKHSRILSTPEKAPLADSNNDSYIWQVINGSGTHLWSGIVSNSGWLLCGVVVQRHCASLTTGVAKTLQKTTIKQMTVDSGLIQWVKKPKDKQKPLEDTPDSCQKKQQISQFRNTE